MAINKDKNINLQLTISKADYERLLKIIEHLNNELFFDINKSQAISYLIKSYNLESQETKAKAKAQTNEYKALVLTLKERLKASYPQLQELTNISASTIKKYALGTQTPKGENLKKLNDALKKYGIID